MRTLRRSIISSLMVLSITTATPAAAHDVPAGIERIQAQLDTAERTAACAASGAAPSTTVSPRMADLIAIYRAASDNLDAVAPTQDEAAWTAAESNWMAAEVELLNERPRNAADLAAKFDTILDLENSEGEFARIQRLSEDAHFLAGAAK
jgi:hypothetical protein